MRQLSLLDDAALARVMPAIKAVMNRIAGVSESEGRDLMLDKINMVARYSGLKLTRPRAMPSS